MRRIIQLEEAKDLIDPIKEAIHECIEGGFEDYLQLRRVASEQRMPAIYENRTKANLIHDHIKSRVTEKFSGMEGYEPGTWNHIFALKVGDDLFLRFNKLNRKKRISCIPTTQYLNYSRQGNIDGLPEDPTLLFAGYVPNSAWTKINGIYIACPDNEDTLHWDYEITRNTSEEQLYLYNREENRSEEAQTSLVRPKQKPREQTGQTGTDN